jgi:hypothetical protein
MNKLGNYEELLLKSPFKKGDLRTARPKEFMPNAMISPQFAWQREVLTA